MGLAPVPLQLQAFWGVLWPALQADINANGGNWVVTRFSRTMTRNPVFVVVPAALGLPPGFGGLPAYRIAITCTGGIGGGPAAVPAVDNAGAHVFRGQIAQAVLPVGVLFALGGALPGWRDINNAVLP